MKLLRIEWDTPVDVLMHGGDIRYIDLDEGELCHWKYIKRQKLSNGKWRYYYDYGQYAKADMEKAARDLEVASKNRDDARKEYYSNVDKFLDAYKSGDKRNQDSYYKRSKITYGRSVEASSKWLNTYNKHKTAIVKYESTPLYKFTETKGKIKKGAKAVSKFLSGLFKKK